MLIKTVTAAAIASASLAVVMSAQSGETTIIGCVYEEKDAPGRAPNPVERLGISEDYILAEITPAEAAKPAGTSGSASVPTTYSMYRLTKPADTVLKSMVGKRVEATGRVDAEGDDATGQPPASVETNKTDRIVGHNRIHLPEFEVSSIRAIPGSCPSTPTVSR